MSNEAKKKVELVETLVDKIQEEKPLGTETKKKKITANMATRPNFSQDKREIIQHEHVKIHLKEFLQEQKLHSK